MSGVPICIDCDAQRKLLDCAPVADGYDMLTYICPVCCGLFRLVVPERPSGKRAVETVLH